MILNELQHKILEYNIITISENNIDDVLSLMKSNTYFYSKTQGHMVTREECLEDLHALPPHVPFSNKTYVAFYEKESCIAVIDFIEGYPNESTGYIGLFMLHEKVHRKGIGEKLLKGLCEVAKDIGLTHIELACYEENERGHMFWTKMGFQEIRRSNRENDGKIYTLISMKCKL